MAVQRDKVIASAEKLVAKGKIEPAIKEYERLLEDNPNDVNTLNRIGDLWVRINRNDEAVKVFTKIADHYSKDGFFLKAIAIYKKINKLDPSKLDIYARLADLYAKQGLAMEAKSQYQVLADYYLKHGDPSNALSIYRKISELDPNSINVHVKLADLYSQNNQTGEALKEYDRVGRMLLKRGMLDEAVQVFKKALKIDSKNTELVDSLVTALVEAKDFDNAAQIVDTALETNRDNPRLLATLGKIQLAKGDLNAARATLQRGYAADPNDSAIRENLADVSLRSGDANTALEMIGPLVEKALGRGERGTAVEMLNRILRVESNHTPTLERLVAVYVRLNEETNILASMNSLAEAHIGKMRFEDASKVLEKLIEREPQNAQHRNKLQFVRSQMGGIDTMPAGRQAPAASPVTLEIDEPVPSFDMPEDDGLSLDLDASPAIDLDFSLDMPATPTPAPAAPAMSNLKPAVEIAAEEGNDDLDFITEHLTEAEVFAKYICARCSSARRRTSPRTSASSASCSTRATSKAPAPPRTRTSASSNRAATRAASPPCATSSSRAANRSKRRKPRRPHPPRRRRCPPSRRSRKSSASTSTSRSRSSTWPPTPRSSSRICPPARCPRSNRSRSRRSCSTTRCLTNRPSSQSSSRSSSR
jgi:tetratricopeptide (TPR) repeat protein